MAPACTAGLGRPAGLAKPTISKPGGPLLASRNREDRLVFAVHAYIESQGYTLVGVGADAEQDPFTCG